MVNQPRFIRFAGVKSLFVEQHALCLVFLSNRTTSIQVRERIFLAKSDPTNWTARFVNWGERNCYGRIIRGICVFGTMDLTTLLNRRELFANKFHLNADPIAYQCLEELIVNKSKLDLPLNDATFYRQMPFLLPT